MPDIIDPLSRIDAVLSHAEASVARAFREAVDQIKNATALAEIADLLEQGRYDEAVQRVTIIAERTAQAVNLGFIDAGNSTGAFLQNAGLISLGFDQINYRAVAAMQASSLRLIKEFTDGQIAATRTSLVAGIQAGIGPREQARNFRDVIGLAGPQAQAVLNYRRALESVGQPGASESEQAASLTRQLRDKRTDRTVRRFIAERRRLPGATIDKYVGDYARRWVDYRSRVIARTESLRATHAGTAEMYAQAIDRGDIDASQIEREWHTHIDGRERLSHRVMNTQKKPWGVPFDSLHGPIMYPGDPSAPAEETIQCRCLVTYRIKRRRGP